MRAAIGTLLLTFVAGCAGNTHHLDAGVMFARARGEIALQNSGGTLELGNNQHTLGALGLDSTEASPYLKYETVHDAHHFRANGFKLDSEGSGTLGSDFGDITIGSAVQSSLDFTAVAGVYVYDLLRDDQFRIGIGGQLAYYQLDVTARSGGSHESVTTDVIVPMPCVEANWYLGNFTLFGSGAVMGADLGDASGRYIDLEGSLRWKVLPEFDLFGGYRYVLMDAYGEASSRDFDADVEVSGWFLGGAIHF